MSNPVLPKTMRALTCPRYGDPSVLVTRADLPVPELTATHRLLVRVDACSLNALDWRIMSGSPFLVRLFAGLLRPFAATHGVPGADFVGTVVAVRPEGGNVTRHIDGYDKPVLETGNDGRRFSDGAAGLSVGDRVVGCEVKGGALAEYIAVPHGSVTRCPASIDTLSASCCGVAFMTAIDALDRDDGSARGTSRERPLSFTEGTSHLAGKHLLVKGASGGVGTFAVTLGKLLGARVTAMCGPGKSAIAAKSAGADEVLDYNKTPSEDLADDSFDAIIDCANFGTPIPVMQGKLRDGGWYKLVGGNAFFGPSASIKWHTNESRRLEMLHSDTTREGLDRMVGLLESGAVKPVIGHTFSFDEATKAMELIHSGHPHGKVVVIIRPESVGE